MAFRVPLEDRDPDHGAHHPNQADLQPGLSAQPVEEENGEPCENEQDEPDTASREVGDFGVGDAPAREEGGLSVVSEMGCQRRRKDDLRYSRESNLCP